MNQQLKGVLLIVLSAMCFGAMAPLAKIIYSFDIAPSFLLTIRFFTASALLWIYIRLSKQKINYRLTKEQGILLLVIGGGVYFTLSILYFNAIRYIPVSLSVLIFYTFPFMVNLFAFFVLKEKINFWQLCALMMAFAGLILSVSLGDVTFNYIGVVLSLLSAVGYAAYMLLLGIRKISTVDSVAVAAYSNSFTAFSFLIYCLLRGELHASMPWQGWSALAFIAVFSTAIAILTLSKGIRLIGAAKASIVSTVEPIEGVLLSFLLLGETMNLTQGIGMVMILSAIVILNLGKTQIKGVELKREG